MSIILFVIGAGLWSVGSIRLGTFEADGPNVRLAGFVLTLPLIAVRLVLWTMVDLMFRSDPNALGFVAFLELPAMALAVGLAYVLVARDEDGLTILPRQEGKPDDRSRPGQDKPQSPRASKPTTKERRDHPLNRPSTPPAKEAEQSSEPEPRQPEQEPQANVPRRRTNTNRRNFPTVMTTAEAASYLNMTEQAVIDLIEQGKLTAARINYRYRISRTVLDDFIKHQQEQNSD